MAHGGSRRGAGRRPGAIAKRSRAVAERATAEGVTPLEVMLDNMRFYHSEAIEALNKLLAAGAPVPAEGEGDEPHAEIVEQLRTILVLRKMAGEEAARAAPYVHPRVGYDSGAATGDPEFVPLAERLAYYQREDDIKAAGDKVVPLKKPH